MSYETYKILHVLGLVLVMLGLGAILGSGREVARARRVGSALHGVGVLAMIVAGFGMMARTGIMGPENWPLWLILKMGIWLVIALLPVLVKKRVLPGAIGWLLAAGLAAIAAWLALTKPFVD